MPFYDDMTIFSSEYYTNWGFTNSETREFKSSGKGSTPQKTPNFFKLKAIDRPFNNYEMYVYVRDEPGFVRTGFNSADLSSDYWHDLHSQLSPNDHSLTSTHLDGVKDRALMAAALDIKDMKVNFAQMISEGEMTIALIASTANRLAQAIGGVKSRNWRQVKHALGINRLPANRGKNVAQDWLALQYGWLPLLSDVRGAAEHLAGVVNNVPPVLRAKKRRSEERITSIEHPFAGSAKETWTITTKTDATVYLEYTMASEYRHSLSTTGILDPALLAWELLPWSFVVDWFVPVGNYLQALGFDWGLDFRRGGHTLWSEIQTSCNWSGTSTYNTTTTYSYSGNSIRSFVKRLDRVQYLASPTPSLPTFKNPLSIAHAANALALLRGAFK